VELSEAQAERVNATLRFARARLGDHTRAAFSRELWDEAASFGLAGLPIPEEWGGSGLDVLDTMLVLEALGKGCDDAGLIFSLCAHMFACAVPVWRSGSAHQREALLRDIACGRLICANAATEPGAGSDIYGGMKTTARRVGHDYVLDGTKCFATNAPVADLFLLYARTSGMGIFGISAFLIPKDAPGLQVAAEGPKIGLRTSPWGTLYMDGCRVSADTMVGPEGAGAALFADSMTWERGCLFAFYVGAMERTLERCVEHARTRMQFGHRLGSFQSVSNRIVDMKLRLEVGRLLLYRVGELSREGRRCDEAAALSKLWISEAAVQSGLDAVQVFGATGMLENGPAGSLLLDALPSRIFSGTSEMQRVIIAKLLGLS
jgi:alkylation response protein AidB-like acyl-CoA dehydrogenase